MEWINRMRKKDKGFTLVEIIVVLVILAILAAFTIPSMLGFISDARNKACLAQAREVYVAAQAAATEKVGTQGATKITAAALKTSLEKAKDAELSTIGNASMQKYLGTDIPAGAYWTVTVEGTSDTPPLATGKITEVTYTDASGYSNTITP